MSKRNEKPTHVGFKSQEGNCGLQESDWAPGWDGGAVDILLRRGFKPSSLTRKNAQPSPFARRGYADRNWLRVI